MKIAISISLTILFFIQGICGGMDICEQIHKMSTVFMHYDEHKGYGDSFLDYVIEDYVQNDVKKQGHHTDSKQDNIPTHSHHSCCNPLVFIAVVNTNFFSLLKLTDKSQYNSYPFHYHSGYLDSLYQPPKV